MVFIVSFRVGVKVCRLGLVVSEIAGLAPAMRDWGVSMSFMVGFRERDTQKQRFI